MQRGPGAGLTLARSRAHCTPRFWYAPGPRTLQFLAEDAEAPGAYWAERLYMVRTGLEEMPIPWAHLEKLEILKSKLPSGAGVQTTRFPTRLEY